MSIPTAIKSLLDSGTKLWIDSVDPELVIKNKKFGATGATSNPIIISELVKSGSCDDELKKLRSKSQSPTDLTWNITDWLVSNAESHFVDVFDRTKGNDGYVSFELDPLIEDVHAKTTILEKSNQYVELAKKWSKGHSNRMIKVPATPAGIGSLEEIVALGIPVNVTLIFSKRQYEAARDAVWKGIEKKGLQATSKSVFSIFVSRVDIAAEVIFPSSTVAISGELGIFNARFIWGLNQDFWKDKGCALSQEIVFASTGTKKPTDKPWKYVEALSGSDIQTNPPATNDAVASSQVLFKKGVFTSLSQSMIDDVEKNIRWNALEDQLMREGLEKFCKPQSELIQLVTSRW